jgi:hypothetical protein
MKHTQARLVTLATLIASIGFVIIATIQAPAFAGGRSEIQPDHERGGPDIGKMLVNGLKNTDGCLKVITAETSVGTSTIIAWFENKDAVERWYYSNTHERMMRMIGANPEFRDPMEHVEDAESPVMVMASITPAKGESVIPGPMPVSQISIELYRPLDAGASVNGRLMPKEIKLEHFRELDSLSGSD